jgi:hypothetical protein
MWPIERRTARKGIAEKRHLKVGFFAGGELGYYFKVLVPEAGLELAQGCPRGILSQNPQVSLSPPDKPT